MSVRARKWRPRESWPHVRNTVRVSLRSGTWTGWGAQPSSLLCPLYWQDWILQTSYCGGAWTMCVWGERGCLWAGLYQTRERGWSFRGSHTQTGTTRDTLQLGLLDMLLAQLLEGYTLYKQVFIYRPPPWPTREEKVTGLLELPVWVLRRSVGVQVWPVVCSCSCVLVYVPTGDTFSALLAAGPGDSL